MTNARFAELAAHITERASNWISSCLILPERVSEKILSADKARFIAHMRMILDHMEDEQ